MVTLLPKEHIWDVEGRVRGVSLGDSQFQFFFESEADLRKILNKRPCHFNKWSFALERWEPNSGPSFPDSMTFWVRTEGLPAEFWEEEALKNFGRSLGVVHRVDPTNGRFQLSVKGDIPLRFNKNAQLPSGEVVRVKLFYEKLFRWCTYCRRICHELELCPLLDDSQRQALLDVEAQGTPQLGHRGENLIQHHRIPQDISVAARRDHGRKNLLLNAGSSSSRRLIPSNQLERTGGSRNPQSQSLKSSQRNPSSRGPDHSRLDNYVPRRRHVPLPALRGTGGEDGRKRRFEDSFAKEKSFEPSSKGRKGPSRPSQVSTSAPSHLKDSQKLDMVHSLMSDSQQTLSDTLMAPLRAK